MLPWVNLLTLKWVTVYVTQCYSINESVSIRQFKKMSQNDDDSHKKRQNESADSAFIFCVAM